MSPRELRADTEKLRNPILTEAGAEITRIRSRLDAAIHGALPLATANRGELDALVAKSSENWLGTAAVMLDSFRGIAEQDADSVRRLEKILAAAEGDAVDVAASGTGGRHVV